MLVTRLKRQWTRQPASRPRTRRNICAILPSMGVVLHPSGVRFGVVADGAPVRKAGILGLCYTPTTSVDKLSFSIPALSIGTGNFTLFYYFHNTAALTANSYIMGTDLNYFGLSARHSLHGGNAGLFMDGTNYDTGVNLSSAGSYKVVIRRIGTTVYVAANRLTSSFTSSDNVGYPAVLALMQAGADGAGFSPTGTEIALSGIEARAWSNGEVARYIDNPWSVFEPEEIPLFQAAGGGSVSLSIQNSLHGHTCDSLPLSLDTYLAVQESMHAHAADNLVLDTTGNTNLTIIEALHAHSADNLTLNTSAYLAIAKAIHAHLADNIGMSAESSASLSINDVLHGHSADGVVLHLDSWLAIVDSLHAHFADTLVLSVPSAPGTCPTAAEIAEAVLATLNANTIPVNIAKVNGLTVDGTGTEGDPWGPG